MTEQENPHSIPEVAARKFFGYLNIHEEPKGADAVFVLGAASTKPAEKAAELWRQGFAPKIAFISQGGKFGGDTVWGMSEVDKYRQVLHDLGIPDADLVYQDDPSKQTRNTLAEAKAAIPFLRERGIEPHKLILVSRPIHQRRAHSTFMMQHPDIGYINVPADEPLDLNDPEEIKRLIQEAERLLDYGIRKNDIQRPDIPFDILRAAAQVRMYLKATHQYESRIKPARTA